MTCWPTRADVARGGPDGARHLHVDHDARPRPAACGREPQYVERIGAYVDEAQRRDVRIIECITDAKGDRSRPPGKQDDPDAYARVVDRARTASSFAAPSCTSRRVPRPRDDDDPDQGDEAGRRGMGDRVRRAVNFAGVKIINTTYAPRHPDIRDFPVSGQAARSRRIRDLRRRVRAQRANLPRWRVGHAAVFAHSLGLWERLGGLSAMADGGGPAGGLRQLVAEAKGWRGGRMSGRRSRK